MKRFIQWIALALILCLTVPFAACAEENAAAERVTFLLMCNEGMKNEGDNVGNTLMAVSFDPELGTVRLLMFTWDTFIQMEGYDVPQLIDQPFRVTGVEGTLKAFNENFNQNIEKFLSVNYLNLANMIDAYGGVNIDITRPERNALNSMVQSKKNTILSMAEIGLIEQSMAERLAEEYYLDGWGEETHLNGLQAVGFGWLQYDSVYNCCLREGKVISDLFNSVSDTINTQVAFYTDDTDVPELDDDRRIINLDNVTDDDIEFLHKTVKPIFDRTYHNLSDDEIISISLTLCKAAYLSSRQGQNVFKTVVTDILPLEAKEPYDNIAGIEGHSVDYEANAAAITEFLLYGEGE